MRFPTENFMNQLCMMTEEYFGYLEFFQFMSEDNGRVMINKISERLKV